MGGRGLPEGTPRTTSALELDCAQYFNLAFKGVPSHQYGLSKQWITTPSWAYVADDGVEVVRVVNDGANQANGDEKVDAKLEQLRCMRGTRVAATAGSASRPARPVRSHQRRHSMRTSRLLERDMLRILLQMYNLVAMKGQYSRSTPQQRADRHPSTAQALSSCTHDSIGVGWIGGNRHAPARSLAERPQRNKRGPASPAQYNCLMSL